MKNNLENSSHRYCGRTFTANEIECIQRMITDHPKFSRARLSREVCNEFRWLKPDGNPKEMSCRVAMLRMHRDGLISLPPPQHKNSNGKTRPAITNESNPQFPIDCPAGRLGPLEFRLVQKNQLSSLWNELIERYHYLGHKPLPGAQMRYLVYAGADMIAAMGFGAAAWKVAPRDQWIGWDHDTRKQKLLSVVNNARFLILPWVTSKNLASKLLAAVARRIPDDWSQRYGYRPVLLETFVQADRFKGTCYKAANWIHVGKTQGRGKLDRHYKQILPEKEIFLMPLHKNCRNILCNQNPS